MSGNSTILKLPTRKQGNAPHSRRFAKQGHAAEIAERPECAASPRFGLGAVKK
jgi:hypothetical protein